MNNGKSYFTNELICRMSNQICIGSSQKWDGSAAAKEAIDSIKSELTEKPTFIFVFTTIHYKNQSKEILNNVINEISSEVPIVGGTVPGFITKSGVFARGIVVVTYRLEDSVAFTVHADHTKRDPKKAALDIVNQINNNGIIDKYKTKILIEFIAGPTVPQFPIIRRKKVIQSMLAGKILSFFGR